MPVAVPSVHARLLRADPVALDPAAVGEAAAVLIRGGLVALPTETVYGLGANARDADAVRRVFAVKGRPPDNPLICHVADAGGLELLARDVPPLAARLAARWWPGPLTLVVDAAGWVPQVVTGGLDTVAVRVPAHPVALAVLRRSGLPVAAPSANRSGRPSPTTAQHVLDDLGSEVDLVLDAGPCVVGVESTVVDARGDVPIILRPGAVTAEDLGAGPEQVRSGSPASPGTRYRHYAPACAVVIAASGEGASRAAELAADGRRVGLVAPGDAAQLARTLYAEFRAAEASRLDVVVVEAVDEHGLGRAVMERVRRAARS
jgi:L-threonylcarbamoyladenylate synthase